MRASVRGERGNASERPFELARLAADLTVGAGQTAKVCA